MTIGICGITGYIGNELRKYLKSKHSIIAIYRSDFRNADSQLLKKINECDIIINLAGSTINTKWNKKNKKNILESRTETTSSIVHVLNKLNKKKKLIQISAVGIYKSGIEHEENSGDFNHDFLATVVKKWENEVYKLNKGIEFSILRLGVVIGRNSPFVLKMNKIYSKGLGGKLGDGLQSFTFIHINDLLKAIEFIMNCKKGKIIYNICSPITSTNKEFNKIYNQILIKRGFFGVPEVVLNIIFGPRSKMILEGAIVKPNALIEQGFKFSYPSIESCLKDVLKNKN